MNQNISTLPVFAVATLLLATSFPGVSQAEQAAEAPEEDAPSETAVAAETDATGSESRWDNSFSLMRCERAPQALPAGMDGALSTVVTITTPDGVGAGYIASPDGFVFTAAHVVGDGVGVEVATYGGPSFPAKLVRVDPTHDVAMLHVPGSGHPCLVPPSDLAPLGSEVYAIGAPGGSELSHSVTKGIISGRREWESHRFIQTDVALNAGNSGGPLLDVQGQVLGIVSWKVAGLGVEGLSFGIPHEAVVDFLGLSWGDTSSDPDNPGALIEMMAVDQKNLPEAYLPVITRPEGAKPLLPPTKPQKRSMLPPMVTLAAGGALVAGSWAWSSVDPYTKPVEWEVLRGTNAAGFGAMAIGGIWTLSNLAWNRSIHVSASPVPGGLSIGGSF